MSLEIVTARVKCLNKECADYDAMRVIELPHLGDGVFLLTTTVGIMGLPVHNLLCGTCMKAVVADALVPSDHAADADHR